LFWLKPPKAKLLLHATENLLCSTPGASFGCLWSFLWQPTSWRQGCAVVLGYPPIGVLERKEWGLLQGQQGVDADNGDHRRSRHWSQCECRGRQWSWVRMGCGGVLHYGCDCFGGGRSLRRCGISRYIIPFNFFLLLSKAAPVFPLLGAAVCYRFGLEHPL
jgi:hypothetical protein